MTYNVFSGTLNPTHFTSSLPYEPRSSVECVAAWYTRIERDVVINLLVTVTIFTAQLAKMATCAVHITISKVFDQLVVSAIDRQTVLILQCIAALTR